MSCNPAEVRCLVNGPELVRARGTGDRSYRWVQAAPLLPACVGNQ